MKNEINEAMVKAYKNGVKDALRQKLGRDITEEEWNEEIKKIMESDKNK